jgi:hypothetical protein
MARRAARQNNPEGNRLQHQRLIDGHRQVAIHHIDICQYDVIPAGWSVPGTARQPLPEKGRPNPSTPFIEKGRWVPGFRSREPMLDRHMKKHSLEDQDWRPAMYKALGAEE